MKIVPLPAKLTESAQRRRDKSSQKDLTIRTILLASLQGVKGLAKDGLPFYRKISLWRAAALPNRSRR
jgi:hypothetical protein